MRPASSLQLSVCRFLSGAQQTSAKTSTVNWLLLLQVQRLKLDTEAAMLELDQILRANELSISLVAAVPALLMSWTLLRGLWGLLLVRPTPDARREATPCR
jgi:hypothetical protein